jgi:hypothetical protein
MDVFVVLDNIAGINCDVLIFVTNSKPKKEEL